MEKFIEFAGNHYVLFLTITIILIFALIGYIVDTKRGKNKITKDEEIDETLLEHIDVNNNKSLQEAVETGVNKENIEQSTAVTSDVNINNGNNNEPQNNETQN